MKFIKLTKVFIPYNGKTKEAGIIYINIDKVKVLEPFENFTCVNVEDFSDMIYVKETPEEIMEMINSKAETTQTVITPEELHEMMKDPTKNEKKE